MAPIDDELAKAVADSERADPIGPVARAADEPPAGGFEPPPSRRSLGLLAGLLVAGGALLVLVLTSFKGSAIYSKKVDELLAERDRLASRNVRVEGSLVKGSLRRRDDPCEYRFNIAKNGADLEVRFPQCVVPDTFRDVPGMDVDVTAEGKLSAGGYFEATQIMAKCPSKYEMKQRASKGEAAPHARIL